VKTTTEVELTKPYRLLLEELAKDTYCTWSVFDYFLKENIHPKDKINIILRIDVDFGLHLCPNFATLLKENGITNASFYFLTFPSRYYNIWKSDIAKIIADRGFEVGLHTDHYYEQLISGKDAIEGIKEDVKRMNDLIGKSVYGMVYHGHKAINALGTTNWEIYKNTPPEELGLVYHDGVNSPYTKPGSDDFWRPNTDYPVLSDFVGVVGAWKYCPSHPLRILRKIKAGQSINVVIHPHNAFKWWINWDYSYGENMPKRATMTDKLINLYKIKVPCIGQRIMDYLYILYHEGGKNERKV